MKASIYKKYGSPDVIEIKEIKKPVPKDNEILVKIKTASVNPLDWHIMRGAPFLVRLTEGLFKPKHELLGADLAGIVEEVGKNVKKFKPGDEVFGDIGDSGLGAFAEYACVNEDSIIHKPANISFENAAVTPVAALTALQGLLKGQIHSDQQVLINGASGGVGTFAVQIARSYEAEVTGVCSSKNFDMVRSIGANHVIDYTQEDFTRKGQQYDLIIDAVGNRSVKDYARILRPKGICVIIGFTSMRRLFHHMLRGKMYKRLGKKIGLMGVAKMNKEDLTFISKLIETSKVVPVIDRSYPLNEVAEAIRYLEKGHASGKVAITIN